MKQKLTAVSYLRSSPNSPHETLESQRHDIGEACERLGIQLVEEFTDDHLSTIQPRPGLERLITRIRSGEKVDVVLVRSMTRLTRNIDWLIRFEHEIKQARIDLLSGPYYLDRSKREHFIALVREVVNRNTSRPVRP